MLSQGEKGEVGEIGIDFENMNDRPSVAKKINRFTASAIISSMYGDDANYDDNDGTHFDSHANMIVCGKYC